MHREPECYSAAEERAMEDAEEMERIEAHDREPYEDDADWHCPTCNGGGTVNPLTAPADFFCVGTTDCPHCDGTGEING